MTTDIAVIFDMDGVLIDSYAAHFKSWQQLAAENGTEYSEAEFVAGFGRTSAEVLAEQWSAKISPLTAERIEELAGRKEELFRELLAHDFPAMDGATELIDALRGDGFRLAVGSSGPPENVRLVLEQLGVRPKIDVVVTGSDVTHGKPDPQVFQLAARGLGLAPSRCAVIEDAPAGIEAAHRAGMKCVGLASTGRTPDELSRAALVVPSLRDLTPAELRQLIGTAAAPA